MTVGLPREVFQYLLPEMTAALQTLPPAVLEQGEELRLCCGQPLEWISGGGNCFLAKAGGGTAVAAEAIFADRGLLERMVLLLTGSSFYALEEEFGQGYLTLPGGHRAGLCGQAAVVDGHLKTLRRVVSINLRFARAIPAAAAQIFPYLWQEGVLCHTLLASPPRVGKTTVLRDLAVQLSQGRDGHLPLRVAIADERGEIGGARDGIPQLPIGCRTDVLTGCPKAEGIMLLLRAMSPGVILTDEIGRPADRAAILEALNAGVTMIATAHGASRQELLARVCTGELLRQKFFQRLIFLERTEAGVAAAAVYDETGALLFAAPGWRQGGTVRGLPGDEGSESVGSPCEEKKGVVRLQKAAVRSLPGDEGNAVRGLPGDAGNAVRSLPGDEGNAARSLPGDEGNAAAGWGEKLPCS